jgi:predicted transcriptional regulator
LISNCYIALARQGESQMSLSPIKQEILEAMFLNGKTLKAKEVAKETNKAFQPVNMHLLGLIKMGFVSVPEKGFYIITQRGKQMLGVAETTKENAEDILAYAPHDRAFNFYSAIDKPLSLHAHSLRDFANKLEKAGSASIDFHIKRADFEAWFKCLGDEELARKTALLKKKELSEGEQCKQFSAIVEQRYIELMKLAGQQLPTK